MNWHFATSEGPLGEQVSSGVGGTVVGLVGIAEVVVVSGVV